MRSNAPSCSSWRLYVILDRAAAGRADLVALAEAAIRGGADVIQLRDKHAATRPLITEAQRLLRVTQAAGIPLLINDRADIARHVAAAGVHLGQDDLPIAEARAILGPQAIIGKSTHTLAQALAAEQEGADYIGVGPIFATPTKPAYAHVGTALIRQVAQQVRLPMVCIGGIDQRTLPEVVQAGARCIAIVRAVCNASDPEAAAKKLRTLLLKSQTGTSSKEAF